MPYSVWLAKDYPNIDRLLDIVSTWDYPRQFRVMANPHSFARGTSATANRSARKSKITIPRSTETRSEWAWSIRKEELVPNTKPLWLKFTPTVSGLDWICEVNQGVFEVSKLNNGDYAAYFMSGNQHVTVIATSRSFNGAMNELCKWKGWHSHGSLYDLYPVIHWKNSKPPRDNTHTLTHGQGKWFWWEEDFDYIAGSESISKFKAPEPKYEPKPLPLSHLPRRARTDDEYPPYVRPEIDPTKPVIPVPVGKHAPSDKAKAIIESYQTRQTSNPLAKRKGKSVTRRKARYAAGLVSEETISGIEKYKPQGREVTEYEDRELRSLFKPADGKHGMNYVFTYKGLTIYTNDNSPRNAQALMNQVDHKKM